MSESASWESSRSITFLNLHLSLKLFAENVSWSFGAVYLYKLGFSLATIFLVWAGFFFIRLLIRPLWTKFLFGRSFKKLMIFATALYSLVYVLLAMVHRSPNWLIFYIVFFAVVDTLYWMVYHTYFTVAGQNGTRGKDVFMRQALLDVGTISAPVVAGFVANSYGFNSLWLAGAVFTLLANVPLMFINEVKVKLNLSMKQAIKKVDKVGFWIYATDGFYARALGITWALVLYLMFGDIVLFGFLLSLGILFEVVMFFLMGRFVDRGQIKYAPWIGAGLVALAITGRVFFAYTIPTVIIFLALFTAAESFISPLGNALPYKASKNSGQPLWFQFIAESGWDIGCITSLSFISIFLYLGGNIRYAMLFCLIGIAAEAWVLYRRRSLFQNI